ncbi:MAG: monovalent cation/H(+) antiporter subunit G [Clostridia bacterium]|nr:monovalent cation/H(+) antiporter subunit G [Clostridia bacterium]
MTLRIIIDILIGLGAFFALAGTVGLIRMPDAFCRMQSSTNIATLGLLLAMIGGLLYAIFVMGSWNTAVKIAIVAVLNILANPGASHAIARAAYRHGVDDMDKMVCDAMKEEGIENV